MLFWLQVVPWLLLFVLWLLFAILALVLIGISSGIRWALLWLDHGITTLAAAAVTILMAMRPVPPKGTKPPQNPTATAPATESLL